MVDSFGKRYVIKLISTAAVMLINMLIQFLLPRALSVDSYADYSYNLNIFTSVLAIAILSMDGAFASKISKRLQEKGILIFYGKFLVLVVCALNLLLLLVFVTKANTVLFKGQSLLLVVLALNASIALKLVQEATSLFDCYAMTRYSEPLVVMHKVLMTAFVYILYVFLILRLAGFYLLQMIISLVIVVAMLLVFAFKTKGRFDEALEKSAGEYRDEFVQYCKPLVVANIVTNGMLLFSNWILKNYGGNVEQAYYGVAWQLNSLVAYTFTPLTVLLQREYAVRVKDQTELRNFYQRMLRLTLLVACYFSCYIIVNADIVLESLYGATYVGAQTVTQIIMLYTVLQAWGQVNGAMYTASERTSIFAKLSIATQIVSVVLILLFQVPNFMWPDGLGAVGIGLQKTVSNFFSIFLCGYFNCKFLKLSYAKEYSAPFISLAGFMLLALLTRWSCGLIPVLANASVWFTFLLSGFLYSVIVLGIGLVVMRKKGLKLILGGK